MLTQKQIKEQALKVLIEAGMFIPFDENLKLYHGRKEEGESKEWSVDPAYNNSNLYGSRNLNSVSALSTGDFETAKSFAMVRSLGSEPSGKVYQIKPYRPDALIFNGNFTLSDLPTEQRSKVNLAIFDLLDFPLTKFVPVKFGFQDDVEIVLKEISDYCDKNGVLMINDEAIKQISQTKRNQYGFLLDIDVVQDLARAYNTKQMLTLMPEILMQQYVNKKQEWGYVRMGTDIFPISPRFISSWAIDNNIVGYSVDDIRSSAVMSHIHTYFLFDLDQVNTVKRVEERKNQIEKQFGSLDFLFDFSPDKEMLEILKTSSPEETMAYVKSLKPTLKELYEKVDGNWERFTVEEHTEAVLRIFEDNYAKELPQDLLPFCKLLILVHDMGKGLAAEDGYNKNMTYTLKYSRMFCESFKQCSPAVTELIYFMVAESQKYTSNYYIRKNEYAIEDLKVRLKEKCEELEINASEDQIVGLTNICKMFQACDSGAYTFYGVTRDSKTGQYYNNGNEQFTYSFEKPHGISNRRMKMVAPIDDQTLV